MLSAQLLAILGVYWKLAPSRIWLFLSRDAASTRRNLHPKPIHTRAFVQSGFNEVLTVKAAYPEDGPHRTLQILLIRLRLGTVFRNRTHSVVTNLLAPVVG